MEERDGQHMGVVTKALVKEVPPSSMILRVLFITCREPGGRGNVISAVQLQRNLIKHTQILFFTRIYLICDSVLWKANNYNSAHERPDGHSGVAYGLYLIFNVPRKTTEVLMQITTKTKKHIRTERIEDWEKPWILDKLCTFSFK